MKSKKGISNGIIEKNGKHYMLCGDREVEMKFIKLEKRIKPEKPQ